MVTQGASAPGQNPAYRPTHRHIIAIETFQALTIWLVQWVSNPQTSSTIMQTPRSIARLAVDVVTYKRKDDA